ncbi:MAG: response regulator transcription factor [Bacteroidales bacterium]
MEYDSVRILLAEDDKNLGTVLKAYLEAKGFQTTLAVNGQEALNIYKKQDINFCIIDVMMPVMDGFTLAREIRETNSEIPVLFLTAKSLQEDKLRGFAIGADDYLSKPFNMEELLARIKAILRRSGEKSGIRNGGEYTLGKLRFDANHQILETPAEKIRLTSKESALLKLLCDNLNDTVDRSKALKEIWQDDSYFNARSMDVYITKLRKYLKADASVELMNVHGIGFKLVTPGD